MGGRVARVLVLVAVFGGGGTARAQLGGPTLSLSASEVAGGTAVQATVSLISHGCVTLPITSSTTTLAPGTVSHPASVQVCQGRATFTVQTQPTPTPGDVRISAGTASQLLRVRPPRGTALALDPIAAVGQGIPGTAATPIAATLSLEAPLSASGCTSVYKQTSQPALARFDGQLGHPSCLQAEIVTADRRSVTLHAEAYAVSAPTQVTLSVRSATDSSSAASTLTVLPVSLSSVELDPPSLAAGETGIGRVRLDAAAGAGGVIVQLASSDPARASVPQSVSLASGESAAEFEVVAGAGAGCGESVRVSASLGGITQSADLRLGLAQVLPHPSPNGALPWSGRAPTAAGSALLWNDLYDVYIDDASGVRLLQAKVDSAGNELDNVVDSAITLGQDAARSGYLGVWRRGDNDAYVWRSATDEILSLDTTNPFDPEDPNRMNPSHPGVSGGCVFFSLQAFDPSTSVTANYAFLVRPETADPLTGLIRPVPLDALDPTTDAKRIFADREGGCRAAWLVDRFENAEVVAQEVHFFDGASVSSIPLGPGPTSDNESVRISGDRVVWAQRDAGGSSQIWLFDASLPDPQALQVSAAGAGQGCFKPALDGRHLAYLCGNADGTELDVELHGGVLASDASSRARLGAGAPTHALQLEGEQILWQDAAGGLQHFRAGSRQGLCSDPAEAARFPWLTDSQIAWHGRRAGAGAFDPTFAYRLRTGEAVAPSDPPAPLALHALPGNGSLTLEWEQLLGVQSYDVYVSQAADVGPANFERSVTDAHSPLVIDGLANGTTYHLSVRARLNGNAGPVATPVSATPFGVWAAASASSSAFHALAVDSTHPSNVYAAGDSTVYRSSDAGQGFAPLAGGIAGRDVRALAARGGRVLAVTRDGDVLRSQDSGTSWQLVADGVDYGMSSHSVAIDPASPDVVYAGNLKLDDEVPGVYRSTQGGAAGSWARVNAPELLAYALAIDPDGSSVYAGGNGTPALARSSDGGATWSALALQAGVHALAIDPFASGSLYAGTAAGGVQRSLDGGASWTARDAGLPAGEPLRALLFDPARTGVVFSATAQGVHGSSDAGAHWAPAGQGGLDGDAAWVRALALSGRRLIAATEAGVFALELGALPDADGDGFADALDRCPAFATPDQSDTDGDGTGDACECGDQNGDGTLSVLDLLAINTALFNPGLQTPRCDANGDGLCTVQDVVAVNAAIYGAPAWCAMNPRP
jgi:hypothetical protein